MYYRLLLDYYLYYFYREHFKVFDSQAEVHKSCSFTELIY